jgi:hypothetical protein
VFILGLIVGPALGLLAGDFVTGRGVETRIYAALVAVAAILALVLPIGALELRVGLVTGFLLGALLAVTPDWLLAPD